MTYDQWRNTPQVPIAILQRLEDAGLGDVPQPRITREQYDAAMRGEVVRKRPGRHAGMGYVRRQSFRERRRQYLEDRGRAEDIGREFAR